MAIKVTDLGGEVTLSATELLCSVAGISTLALKNDPHIFDIKTDYDPDNRIIYDVYNIVDAHLYEYTKPLSDATGVLADFPAYTFEKIATDLVVSVDEYLFTVDKALEDTGYATDALVALLHKVFTDSVTSSDTVAWHATLDKIDTVSTYDVFTKTVEFNRFFSDYVSIDDWSNIDKYYTGAKVNIAAVTDYSSSDFNKVLDDVTTTTDANTFYTSKPFSEVTTLSDTNFYSYGKDVQDSSVATDTTVLANTKPFTDITVTYDNYVPYVTKSLEEVVTSSDTFSKVVFFNRSFADFVAVDDFANIDKNYIGTKGNIASIGDYQDYTFTKVLEDTYTLIDSTDIITAKPLFETAAVLDFANVVKIGGDTSIFNASAFNQSTFG